jgi:hypothetical protein
LKEFPVLALKMHGIGVFTHEYQPFLKLTAALMNSFRRLLALKPIVNQ